MPDALVDVAAGIDRTFTLALGGFSLELAGGSLVTHERIPVSRFNHVLVDRIGPGRQTAFFERALDHYFQRALRPTVRVRPPVAPYVDETLRTLAFRPRPETYVVWWARPTPAAPPVSSSEIRDVGLGELDTIVNFWTEGPHRPELRRSLDVAGHHPNSGERLTLLVAERAGVPLGSAVVFERPPIASLHGIATVPDARGQGVASDLVTGARGLPFDAAVQAVVLASDSGRGATRLDELGFRVVREYTEYELPADAELTMPSPGPPQPPRWRPPREASPSPGPAVPG